MIAIITHHDAVSGVYKYIIVIHSIHSYHFDYHFIYQLLSYSNNKTIVLNNKKSVLAVHT